MPTWRALLAIGLCAALLTRAAGCSEDDELATLDVVLCAQDALCADGVCTVDGEEVETERVLARAVESVEGSRFGDAGLFVLATWELDGRWLELEFDVPTDRVGYVDMDIRYEEFVDGAAAFSGDDIRGRIVLVVPRGGDGPPYAAHAELRARCARPSRSCPSASPSRSRASCDARHGSRGPGTLSSRKARPNSAIARA
jgi:hypothetical protein